MYLQLFLKLASCSSDIESNYILYESLSNIDSWFSFNPMRIEMDTIEKTVRVIRNDEKNKQEAEIKEEVPNKKVFEENGDKEPKNGYITEMNDQLEIERKPKEIEYPTDGIIEIGYFDFDGRFNNDSVKIAAINDDVDEVILNPRRNFLSQKVILPRRKGCKSCKKIE